MIQPPLPPERAGRLLGWVSAVSIVMIVIGWLALVVQYEYQVAWLGDYVAAVNALFLVGVAGIVLSLSAQRWGAHRVGPLALRLALSVTTIAVSLVVAEFAARFVLRRVLPDAGPSISLNSLGFRDREFGPKNPDRYRIAIIGDSFTFGNGIAEQDRFSNVIQGVLGPQYEVLNFGHPGNNLPDHLAELDLVLKMSPDFVLLQLYENDFETPDMMKHRPRDHRLMPLDMDERMMRSSVLYRLLIDHWNQFQEATGLAEGYINHMARHLRDPDAPDAVQTSGMLLQFIDRARAAHVPNAGVLFPALYGLHPKGANYPFDYLSDRVSNIYTLAQTPYLDLFATYLTVRDPSTLWVNRFDPHPNAKANQLAAIAILNKFQALWHR